MNRQKLFLILFSVLSSLIAILFIWGGKNIIQMGFDKVFSQGDGYAVRWLLSVKKDWDEDEKEGDDDYYFEEEADEVYIIACPDIGQELEEKTENLKGTIEALKAIIPSRPAVIGVDVFLYEEDFFHLDSLVALAASYGVQLVFACDREDVANLDPELFGFTNLHDYSQDRFIPDCEGNYICFSRLIVKKYLGKDPELVEGTFINPNLFNYDNRVDLDRLDSFFNQLEGKIVLLGIDSPSDMWSFRGEEMPIYGVDLQRCAVLTVMDAEHFVAGRIPYLIILLALLFVVLIFWRVLRPKSFVNRFYDWFVMLFQFAPFGILFMRPAYFYSTSFWIVSLFLYADILLCTLLMPLVQRNK